MDEVDAHEAWQKEAQEKKITVRHEVTCYLCALAGMALWLSQLVNYGTYVSVFGLPKAALGLVVWVSVIYVPARASVLTFLYLYRKTRCRGGELIRE